MRMLKSVNPRQSCENELWLIGVQQRESRANRRQSGALVTVREKDDGDAEAARDKQSRGRGLDCGRRKGRRGP